MKLRIEATNSFYYPDVMVDCGAFDGAAVFTAAPSLLFEVLSRSTTSTDRREKLLAYQRIPCLKAYVIVHQSRKCVEIYRREGAENWTVEQLGTGDCLDLACCRSRQLIDSPLNISIDEIYEDIDVEHGPNLQVREGEEAYTY